MNIRANKISYQKEKLFHDNWARSIMIDEVMVEESFEACTSPENCLIIKKLGDIKGKEVLELGCGAGEASVYLAKKGANVTASDISPEMLNVVRKVAKKHNVTVSTIQSTADSIKSEDQVFDIVYASNLLHHVDIEQTLIEVKRVLKTGGIFVSWDPLAHNPAINLYRKLSTGVRTEDEHPLTMKDIKIFEKYFTKTETYMTWFFTLWIFIKYYFIDRIDPNKERYWKKILSEHQKLNKMYTFLEKLDKIFLSLFPFMKRYCWNVIIFAHK